MEHALIPREEPATEDAQAKGARVERERLLMRERILGEASPRVRLLQFVLLLVLLGAWEIVGRSSSSLAFAPPSAMVTAARGDDLLR